jgi:DegV family protein with EDD domain
MLRNRWSLHSVLTKPIRIIPTFHPEAIPLGGKAENDIVAKITIITDSNACLPAEVVQKYRIGIVPIVLIFGDEILLDGVDITPEEFYARLRTADPLPKTSSPSPAHYLEAFHAATIAGAEGIVVVTLSRKLSMSFNAAHLAAREMEGFPIRVVDGRMATIAQGFVALTAAQAAARDLDIDEVTAVTEKSISGIGFTVMLDTLEYLYRGGRVPAIASLIGSAINLNPVLGNKTDGTVGIIAPTIGQKAAMERVLREVRHKAKDRHLTRLAVMHADALDKAYELLNLVHERFDYDEVYVVELTAVMGAHAGPGVVGLAYQIEDPTAISYGEER